MIIRWKESGAAQSLAEQGAYHLKQGDYEKGIAMLWLALERNPDDAGALFNLGKGLGVRDETGEALEMLKRLVTIEPDYPGAWVAPGVAHARAGRWDEAIRAFREVVIRDPQDGLAPRLRRHLESQAHPTAARNRESDRGGLCGSSQSRRGATRL